MKLETIEEQLEIEIIANMAGEEIERMLDGSTEHKK